MSGGACRGGIDELIIVIGSAHLPSPTECPPPKEQAVCGANARCGSANNADAPAVPAEPLTAMAPPGTPTPTHTCPRVERAIAGTRGQPASDEAAETLRNHNRKCSKQRKCSTATLIPPLVNTSEEENSSLEHSRAQSDDDGGGRGKHHRTAHVQGRKRLSGVLGGTPRGGLQQAPAARSTSRASHHAAANEPVRSLTHPLLVSRPVYCMP